MMLRYLTDTDWQDNPKVLIHSLLDGGYDINLKGIDGHPYQGLTVDADSIVYNGMNDKHNDRFTISLGEGTVRRLVPIHGSYEDGAEVHIYYLERFGGWRELDVLDPPQDGVLAYWDVTGLNGTQTLLLEVKLNGELNTVTRQVQIGHLVTTDSQNEIIRSAGGEASLTMEGNSLQEDTIISVDAVELEDIQDIVKFPQVATPGKIIDLQPDGLEFQTGTGATLTFTYHRTEVDDTFIQDLMIYELETDASRRCPAQGSKRSVTRLTAVPGTTPRSSTSMSNSWVKKKPY